MNIKTKARISWFDFLRGIAILMVITIHTFSYCLSSNLIISDDIIIIRQLLNCAVPLFLAISGFFLTIKQKEKSQIIFLKHQISKIYIPTLIWSLPYLSFDLLYNNNIWYKSFINFISCGFSIYYFIALIIQYYILFPILRKTNIHTLIVTFIITIISVGFISYLDYISEYNLSLLRKAGPFPIWIVFFCLGIYLGKMQERNYSIFPWFIMLLLGIIISFIETKWLYQSYHTGFGIKISTHIYSFAVIVLLFSNKIQKIFNEKSFLFNIITYLGRISFGIYLIHLYLIDAFRVLHLNFGWILSTTIIIIFTITFIYTIKKYFPKYSNYLGF